jgi:hypothetical protein
MYLLYLDDSGSAPNVNEQHLVLGGIALFDAQVNYITRELDRIAARINPADPQCVEFHATDIWNGRNFPWNTIKDRTARREIIKEVLRVFANSYERAQAFACAVHKPSYPGLDPMEIAFEDLTSRFDMMLYHAPQKDKRLDRQRGIIILDESTYETTLQKLARDFRLQGTRWSAIHDIVDVPLFVDSKASRCVQVADHVAYAVYRRYEVGDTSFLDIIINRFDYDGRVYHGLCHKARIPNCPCPACLSRRNTNEVSAHA